MKLKRTRHAASHINYHFVWIPKYRGKGLIGTVPSRLEALEREKTAELAGEVLHLTLQADQVYFFCTFPPTLGPHQIMPRRKGYPALMVRKEFPYHKSRLPNMGRRSYFVGTAGTVTAATIQRYIDKQKTS